MLDAGLELLDERGLGSGLARVTLHDAIVRSGVPRPSAYRVFSNGDFDPQEEFRTALLVHLLGEVSPTLAATAGFTAARKVLEEEQERYASGDPDALAYILREMVRVSTETIWSFVTPRTGAYFATVLSLVIDDDPYPPLVEAHRTLYRNGLKRNGEFYSEMLDVFGLRLRPGLDFHQFSSSFALLVSQVWDGNLSFGAEPTIELPTGPGGEKRPWTPLGLSCVGLILVTVEADPRAIVSARIGAWLDT